MIIDSREDGELKNKLYYVSLASIMLALLIVCSHLTIPCPCDTVDASRHWLSAYLASILPLRYSLQTILVYLLGFIGLPVLLILKGTRRLI